MVCYDRTIFSWDLDEYEAGKETITVYTHYKKLDYTTS